MLDIQITESPPRYEVTISAENKPAIVLTTTPNYSADVYPLIRFLKGDQGPQGEKGDRGEVGEGISSFDGDPLIYYILSKQ